MNTPVLFFDGKETFDDTTIVETLQCHVIVMLCVFAVFYP